MIEVVAVMFLIPIIAAMWAMMACLIAIAYRAYLNRDSE
jgi:hypothetical protein